MNRNKVSLESIYLRNFALVNGFLIVSWNSFHQEKRAVIGRVEFPDFLKVGESQRERETSVLPVTTRNRTEVKITNGAFQETHPLSLLGFRGRCCQ
ncbi:hypothetical protein CEXT_425581 [Caerostris extrusa]|uniref:Uncharacterized protein n=1 Tax=Caerostris extrusa TaxID=172846 RepID=A0AAV4UDB6_CAEEX|nr:hypothetical protein CEXT_425581 [Caerostris extrusa]